MNGANNRLEALMRIKSVTQTQIAKTIGVSRQSVSKKISGKTDFRAKEMFKIQQTYFPEVSLEELFGDEETEVQIKHKK